MMHIIVYFDCRKRVRLELDEACIRKSGRPGFCGGCDENDHTSSRKGGAGAQELPVTVEAEVNFRLDRILSRPALHATFPRERQGFCDSPWPSVKRDVYAGENSIACDGKRQIVD